MNKPDHDHHHHGSATHSLLPSDPALRVKAIETILLEKGLVDPDALDALIDTFQNKVGPRNGAQAVAKAWTDPEFKAWLLDDASAALSSLGFTGMQGEHMVAVENTEAVHNMVVCTLCSCYPWPVLGLPPQWYKSEAYRSRVVIEPRAVLEEFGVTLPEDTEIRVWDSTAEIRYLVIPMQLEGTEGLNEAELAERVSRDSMVGAAL
jgi:nitrile hydratase